jgi:hypothetical protein
MIEILFDINLYNVNLYSIHDLLSFQFALII